MNKYLLRVSFPLACLAVGGAATLLLWPMLDWVLAALVGLFLAGITSVFLKLSLSVIVRDNTIASLASSLHLGGETGRIRRVHYLGGFPTLPHKSGWATISFRERGLILVTGKRGTALEIQGFLAPEIVGDVINIPVVLRHHPGSQSSKTQSTPSILTLKTSKAPIIAEWIQAQQS